MKVVAGREFFVRFGAPAQEIVPELSWALIEKDGSWSEPPDTCDLVVLAGDAIRVLHLCDDLWFAEHHRV